MWATTSLLYAMQLMIVCCSGSQGGPISRRLSSGWTSRSQRLKDFTVLFFSSSVARGIRESLMSSYNESLLLPCAGEVSVEAAILPSYHDISTHLWFYDEMTAPNTLV